MPKIDLQQLKKELHATAQLPAKLKPIYWIYGSESALVRESIRTIRAAVLGTTSQMLNEERLEASELETGAALLDLICMPSLLGGTRLVILSEAQTLEGLDDLIAVARRPIQTVGDLPGVAVLISKDWDGRKKFSKAFLEVGTVVACEEIPEYDREAWIRKTATARKLNLTTELVQSLMFLDPWSMDRVQNEIEKLLLLGDDASIEALQEGIAPARADQFVENFMSRQLVKTWPSLVDWSAAPEEALPLMGLLAWNMRHLALAVYDREKGTRHLKVNPFAAEKLNRHARKWTLNEVVEVQSALAQMDFDTKQTPKHSLGIWGALVSEYCR